MNCVMLVGNVGRDPELRTTPQGRQVASFSLATTEGKDRTQWHRIVVWERQAEHVAQYLRAGDKASVEGRIQSREYEKDGIKRESFEIVAHRVGFLTPKSERGQQAPRQQAGGPGPRTQAPPSHGDWSDDVPF